MGRIEDIQTRVSVALTPVEWRDVLSRLPKAPDLRLRILEQIVDALGQECSGQLEGNPDPVEPSPEEYVTVAETFSGLLEE